MHAPHRLYLALSITSGDMSTRSAPVSNRSTNQRRPADSSRALRTAGHHTTAESMVSGSVSIVTSEHGTIRLTRWLS
jgi:hypothetical protein